MDEGRRPAPTTASVSIGGGSVGETVGQRRTCRQRILYNVRHNVNICAAFLLALDGRGRCGGIALCIGFVAAFSTSFARWVWGLNKEATIRCPSIHVRSWKVSERPCFARERLAPLGVSVLCHGGRCWLRTDVT